MSTLPTILFFFFFFEFAGKHGLMCPIKVTKQTADWPGYFTQVYICMFIQKMHTIYTVMVQKDLHIH